MTVDAKTSQRSQPKNDLPLILGWRPKAPASGPYHQAAGKRRGSTFCARCQMKMPFQERQSWRNIQGKVFRLNLRTSKDQNN